ncbi:MAG: hypothetical protein ACKVRO_09820 [Micropepsaceae bacterium]
MAKRYKIGRTEEQIWSDFEAVAITPYDTLGAPRVGVDEAATNWAKAQYPALAQPSASLEAYLTEMRGFRVLDLVPKCDGIPVYGNGRAYSGIDLYTFRGKCLEWCKSVLTKSLLNEAWEEHNPDQLLSYGNKLADSARVFAEKNATTEWLSLRDPPEADEGPSHETHVVISAAKWCRFWGERGHGLEPYF